MKVSRMQEIPFESRPRERLLRSGGQTLSDVELVAVLLRAGSPGQSVLHLADEVLTENGGLAGLLACGTGHLVRRGLGPAKAATLMAAVELGRRLARHRIPPRHVLERPDTVANYLMMRYARRDQEVMGGLFLDARQRLIADVDLYRGTLSRAAVEPRRVLKEALYRDASSFILFHTHPSGDPAPSTEDLVFTKRVAEAGEALGIELIDHLILGSGGRWVSLRRRGKWGE